MAARGLIIAGLSSGSGKTTITLGLLRALRRIGIDISAAKTGPDYIDTAFLSAASGNQAVNLDAFAMGPDITNALAHRQAGQTLIIEGVMGLFDGTIGGAGSTADLAGKLSLPVILVIDARHQAQTAAAIAAGLQQQLALEKGGATLAGVILNRIASPRHLGLIADSLASRGIPLFGALPADENITVPSRHLGLVQAADLAKLNTLDAIIEAAADLISEHIDLEALLAATGMIETASAEFAAPPPGQNIAVAKDEAFGFCYAHMLDDWARKGASIHPFSPLNDEAPHSTADFIFLPGGYPELHLETLGSATNFATGMHIAATNSVPIYGECGGFMTLGTAIIDDQGKRHSMLGLLDLETSFAARKLHLGYRKLTPTGAFSWPPQTHLPLIAHEFHYTSATQQSGVALFNAADAGGDPLGEMGLVKGTVAGSYAHIIA